MRGAPKRCSFFSLCLDGPRALLMTLFLAILLHGVALQSSRLEPSAAPRSRTLGSRTRSTSSDPGNQSGPETWIPVVNEVACFGIGVSVAGICVRVRRRGLTLQRRASCHWAKRWPAQSQGPNPQPDGAVFERCIDIWRAPNLNDLRRARRVLVCLGSRARTQFGPGQEEKVGALPLVDAQPALVDDIAMSESKASQPTHPSARPDGSRTSQRSPLPLSAASHPGGSTFWSAEIFAAVR